MTLPTTAEVLTKLRAGEAPPAAAMRVFGSPVELSESGNSDNAKSIKVKLKARQRGPINHWYWGTVWHDLSTMRSRAKIALDDTHDVEVGHGRPVMSEYGLEVEGVVITNPDMPDHPANRIAYNLRNGIPQEASIDFGGDYEVVEIPEGVKMPVNGMDAEGPALVVRNWPLRACAICKEGADASTETNTFAKPGSAVAPLPRSISTFSATPKEEQHMTKCEACGKEFDYAAQPEVAMGAVACPHCGATVDQTGKKLSAEKPVEAQAEGDKANPAQLAEGQKPVEAPPAATPEPQQPDPVAAWQAVAVELEQAKQTIATLTSECSQLKADKAALDARIATLSAGAAPVPPTPPTGPATYREALSLIATEHPQWPAWQVHAEAQKRFAALFSAYNHQT
jgi:hypothetical protein